MSPLPNSPLALPATWHKPVPLLLRRCHAGVMIILFTALLAGCPKKEVAKAPPTPPPPTPDASLDVQPATLHPGGSAVLTWSTTNATDVRIEPIGQVDTTGTKTVAPQSSVTYHLVAKGPGGVRDASVRVTVAEAQPSSTAANGVEPEMFSEAGARQDVFFDTNDFSIRPDQESTIVSDAQFLNEHPDLHVIIEGHCDELGSIEYNLALGETRATEVRNALVKVGVDANRLDIISYGKERPFCHDDSEFCWKLNRRAHLVAKNLDR